MTRRSLVHVLFTILLAGAFFLLIINVLLNSSLNIDRGQLWRTLRPSRKSSPAVPTLNLRNHFNYSLLRSDKLVAVFLHIQKTAGSFIEMQLTKFGVLDLPCSCTPGIKVCDCKKDGRLWLFCRYSVGWRCGLHADLTELTNCVPGVVDRLEEAHRVREYAYFTILRDPVERYISEWQHVRRGATWKTAKLLCAGHPPLPSEYEPCYRFSSPSAPMEEDPDSDNLTWAHVPLDRFARCRFNLANNRQTRMLASLEPLGCYADLTNWTAAVPATAPSLSSSQQALLDSAKVNLATRLVVFVLSEYMSYSQYLLQRAFGIVFRQTFFDPRASPLLTHADLARQSLETNGIGIADWRRLIAEHNALDLRLWEFARELFAARLAAALCIDSRLPRSLRRLLTSNLLTSKRQTLIFDTNFRRRVDNVLFKIFLRQQGEHNSLGVRQNQQEYWQAKLARDLWLAGMADGDIP
uniref:Heparan-sulfate 6-O-sulfotransferase n=2 Tax=Schistocephalus solidus TaxID=70667 RepID=A0A0X3P084_SCHSO